MERKKLGGRFGYFLFFAARGGGRGSPRPPGGGGVEFLLKIPDLQEGKGSRGWEGVCGELGILEGGGQIFYFGAEMSTMLLFDKDNGCNHAGLRWPRAVAYFTA